MTWLAWRQYRFGMLVTLALLLAMTAYLVPTGLERFAEFQDSGLQDCVQARIQCPNLRDPFINGYDPVSQVVGWFNFAPAVIGILLAAPLVSEFEQRTYRLAWTQSITREHWLRTNLTIALAGVAVFSVVLTGLMTWWYSPMNQVESRLAGDLGPSFNFEGIMPFSYTLFSLMLGLAAGAVSRRMLVVLPVALVGFTVARATLETLLRQGYSGMVEGLAGEEVTLRSVERFWTIQAVEAAIFLSMAAALLGITVAVVKRRP